MLNIMGNISAMKNILCLGAHCDDIEIGCGGTILKYAQENKDLKVYWVVFSSDEDREKEAIRSANDFTKNIKEKTIIINRFRNSYFPQCWGEIKDYFESIKQIFSPDIIFTHCKGDLHQDHRIIHELTWNTFRNHLIMEYEIAKYDADLGSPNAFVCLDYDVSKEKVGYIMKHFRSQVDKAWFTEDFFMSIMRIRGVESNSAGRFAEGFFCRKLII